MAGLYSARTLDGQGKGKRDLGNTKFLGMGERRQEKFKRNPLEVEEWG